MRPSIRWLALTGCRAGAIALAGALVAAPAVAQPPYGQPAMQVQPPAVMPGPMPVQMPPQHFGRPPRAETIPNEPEDLTPRTTAKIQSYIAEVQEPEARLELFTRRSKLIRTRFPVARVSISDPGVVETVNFTPTEFELIGRSPGETTLTLWFAEPGSTGNEYNYLRYLIRVTRDLSDDDARRVEYGELQKRINEMFPNSFVQLIPIADKLIVKGQARDAKEAANIMALLRDEQVDQTGQLLGPGSFYSFGVPAFGGRATNVYGADDWASNSVISLLEVPGEQQVLLKVRVAELNRQALREMGANFSFEAGDFSFGTGLNIAGAFQAVLSSSDVQFALSALSSNRTTKVLAEPNLVTLSGYPASFIAGGQFAVPTAIIGAAGGLAATTSFHGFGTQISFTPTVVDKDHIRLQVAPTLSEINAANTVDGIPGLRTRSVITTVDLREGQWLAIAGLIQDSQDGDKTRVPVLGDIPILDTLFARKRIQRDETELVILVSPELIHPLEPEQMPMILPGMEVTEPDDVDFFLLGRYEGRPEVHHRSTVWPIYQFRAYDAKFEAMRQAKLQSGFIQAESYYMGGAHGFSN